MFAGWILNTYPVIVILAIRSWRHIKDIVFQYNNRCCRYYVLFKNISKMISKRDKKRKSNVDSTCDYGYKPKAQDDVDTDI